MDSPENGELIKTPIRIGFCTDCPHRAFEHEIGMNTSQSGRCLIEGCPCFSLSSPSRDEIGDEVERLLAENEQLKSIQSHADCHDIICNSSRRNPRYSKDNDTCNCRVGDYSQEGHDRQKLWARIKNQRVEIDSLTAENERLRTELADKTEALERVRDARCCLYGTELNISQDAREVLARYGETK